MMALIKEYQLVEEQALSEHSFLHPGDQQMVQEAPEEVEIQDFMAVQATISVAAVAGQAIAPSL